MGHSSSCDSGDNGDDDDDSDHFVRHLIRPTDLLYPICLHLALHAGCLLALLRSPRSARGAAPARRPKSCYRGSEGQEPRGRLPPLPLGSLPLRPFPPSVSAPYPEVVDRHGCCCCMMPSRVDSEFWRF